MLSSKAITKIQSLILVAVFIVVAVVGGAAYLLLSRKNESAQTIKIGILADLDSFAGISDEFRLKHCIDWTWANRLNTVCVQRRLAFSAGVSPARVRARGPVA